MSPYSDEEKLEYLHELDELIKRCELNVKEVLL